jgi:hypothetical protein
VERWNPENPFANPLTSLNGLGLFGHIVFEKSSLRHLIEILMVCESHFSAVQLSDWQTVRVLQNNKEAEPMVYSRGSQSDVVYLG